MSQALSFGLLAAVALPALAQDALIFPPGEGPFSWQGYEEFAADHDYSGTTLTISGPGTGADARRLENLYAYFAAATGARVAYSGSDGFEQDIVIATQAGSPPHIASFPQPGLVRDLAARGGIVALGEAAGRWTEETFAAGASWADLARFQGPDGQPDTFGIFFGTDIKSLVWYSPPAFEDAGYEIPQTMEALKALSERIVADGGTPWCIGLGAGAATGWPATDWVEDLLLRTQPTEVYDGWVENQIPFDDPRILRAMREYGHFARNDAYVAGGADAVATIDFRDSPAGLFTFPPECYLHKQASFIPAIFPEEVEMGLDADFFYFPPYAAEDLGRPLLGSGGLTAITRDAPVARGFIEFLKLPIAHEIAIAQGQFLTPHLQANPDAYPSDTQRALGEILTSATTFRFDGSDLMPSEIGTNAFWRAMVAYTTGTPAEEAAGRVQARWQSMK